MCLCVRWVDEEYSVNEDIIGLVHVSKTDSNTLFTELKAALICCMLPLDKCRGQAYEGAANYSGKHRGVAALIKKEENAVHVHCLAHSFNLPLQDVTHTCLSISEGLLFIKELIRLIKWSPKRHSLLETLKLEEDSPDSLHLRTLCPTRWTVRNGAGY